MIYKVASAIMRNSSIISEGGCRLILILSRKISNFLRKKLSHKDRNNSNSNNRLVNEYEECELKYV